MFRRDSRNIYRSSALEALPWLDHGFGTRASPVPEGLATLHQIHSDRVLHAHGVCGSFGEGDALVAGCPGQSVAVKTADCLPVLMADLRQRRVAAVHAGWRGAVQQIVIRVLEAMDARPEHVCVALGPAIGPCCYEVGPEVAAQFRAWFPERDDLDRKTRIDLAEANRRQLLAAGVPAARIDRADLCTMCGGEEFYSWRRERQRAGRMYSWIGVRLTQ